MRKTLATLALITIANLMILYQKEEQANTASEQQLQEIEFKLWSKAYNKNYGVEEYQYRLSVYLQNVMAINEHNARYQLGQETFQLAINQFADLTEKEFVANYLTLKFPKLPMGRNFKPNGVIVQANIDWSEQGAVTHVKNQGACGSSWAFSATGSLEGRIFQQTGKLVSLSEQELLDCAGQNLDTKGCDGGWTNNAFMYVIENGITTENVYPYQARVQACQQGLLPRYRVQTYVNVAQGSQATLEAAITLQPVRYVLLLDLSVAIDASGIQFYRTGIYNKKSCSNNLNHGVLAVGLGTENAHTYYKIKNSWGNQWGEAGYIRIARKGDGLCPYAASFPI